MPLNVVPLELLTALSRELKKVLNEEEVDRYSSDLNALFNEIDRVNSVDINEDVETMFSASNEDMKMFDDDYLNKLNYDNHFLNNNFNNNDYQENKEE